MWNVHFHWNMDNFKFNFLLRGQLESFNLDNFFLTLFKYYHVITFLVTLLFPLLLECSVISNDLIFTKAFSAQVFEHLHKAVHVHIETFNSSGTKSVNLLLHQSLITSLSTKHCSLISHSFSLTEKVAHQKVLLWNE